MYFNIQGCSDLSLIFLDNCLSGRELLVCSRRWGAIQTNPEGDWPNVVWRASAVAASFFSSGRTLLPGAAASFLSRALIGPGQFTTGRQPIRHKPFKTDPAMKPPCGVRTDIAKVQMVARAALTLDHIATKRAIRSRFTLGSLLLPAPTCH